MTSAQIGYLILYAFCLVTIYVAYRKALVKIKLDSKVIQKRMSILAVCFLLWTIYLYLIGESGVLWNFELPPRFLLFIFLPLTIITFFLFYKNRNSQIFKVIPKQNAIYFQSFRIVVELVILATYLEGVFPIETTFEGYNYEIIVGLLAPIIAFGVYQKKWFSEKVALLFNIIGLSTLAIIIFIVITSLFFPAVWGDNVPEITAEFSTVPYLYLPGFLAPLAIFVHIFSIIQLHKSRKK